MVPAAHRDADREPPGAAVGGVGEHERGCDPYVIDTAIDRFAELLRETCPDLVVHPGRRCAWPRSAARAAASRCPHRPGQPHPRHVARRRRSGAAARSDRLHRVRRRRHAHGGTAVVAARLDRGDRRRRGGRAPLRLRPFGKTRADVDRARRPHRPSATPPAAAPGAARVRHLRGDAEPVPRTRHADPRPASTTRSSRSPIRWSRRRACCAHRCVPDCCRRWRSTSHTAASVPACSRSGMSTRPARASCPTSSRRCASCSPARRRPPAMAVWREISAGARRRRTCRSERVCRPACTRLARRRSRPARTRPAPLARSTRPCSSGSACQNASRSSSSISTWSSAATRSRPRGSPSVGTRRAISTRLRAGRRRAGRAPREGDPSGRRTAARRRRAVRCVPCCVGRRGSSQPGLPAPPPGAGPQPHRRRRRRGPSRRRRGGHEAGRRSAKLTRCRANTTLRGCSPRWTCSNGPGLFTFVTGDWPGLRQKAHAVIQEDEGPTLVVVDP